MTLKYGNLEELISRSWFYCNNWYFNGSRTKHDYYKPIPKRIAYVAYMDWFINYCLPLPDN